MQSESSPPKKGEKSSLKKRWPLIITLSLLLVATVCFIVLIPIFTVKAMQDSVIRIPADATRETVRDSISKYLGDSYASAVMKASLLRGSDFSNRHGAYLITEGMSPLKAERRLASGGQHPVKIVINAVRTPEILAQRVAAKLDFSPDSLLKAMQSPEILKELGLSPSQVMTIFPEATYEVYWSASPEDFILKTASAYEKIWTPERRHKAEALGLTPEQVVTLCSIVEEETIKTEDKGKIGRLYINRLKKGMKLQADPTVKYALGDFSLRRIRGEHLKTNSPYNTYQVYGLPPGPIRTTSAATIDLVLDSPPSDDIYMCAKDDFSGYHVFSSNYSDHLKNARRYQQALNRRNIH